MAKVEKSFVAPCERCPIKRADPGFDLRAMLVLYDYLHAFPQGSALGEHRWREWLRSVDQDEADEAIDLFGVAAAVYGRREVESFRRRQAEMIRQRQAELAAMARR